MIVFQPSALQKPSQTLFAQPGKEHPISDFLDKNGKPILFALEFKFGRLELADNLGQYLLDNGMAHASPILLLH